VRQQLNERGVALALVLWLLVIRGTVAAAVVGSTRRESQVLINARARAVAGYAAESGIVAAMAQLQRRIGAAGPDQQAAAWAGVAHDIAGLEEVSLGSARFTVVLENLSGRLDLNQAQPEALAGLFSQFTSGLTARAVLDALLDWRDGDDLVRPQGAERDAYVRSGSPYVPRNAPLSLIEEFRRLPGVSEPFARALDPYITVSGDLRIDVNGASEPVLASIPGIGPTGARAIVSRRRSAGPFTSIADVQSFLGRRYGGAAAAAPVPGLMVSPSRVLLLSRGWSEGHPLTHEIQAAYAVVGQQLRLQSWREQDL
jgi:general secretion pathway protein K